MKERLLVALATLAMVLVVALSPYHHPIAYAEGGPTATPTYSDCQGGNHCGG